MAGVALVSALQLVAAAELAVEVGDVIGKVNPRYASWTIDASYNRGFVHIDFENANLLAAATSLAPSTLRFGGGGNDYLQYAPFAPCTSHNDSDQFVCLNTTHWNALYTMAAKADADFLFGIAFDMVKACDLEEEYEWSAAPAIAMIKYIQSQKQQIWGFELGNEVNNRAKSCKLQPGQQAAAFKAFATALEALYPDPATRPKLLGPDIGYLNPQVWLTGFLGNFSALHAVTYHVYSWLTKRNYNYTMPIDNALRDGEGWYPGLVHRMAPGAEVWAGEDGPISGGEDGTCQGFFPNGTSTDRSVCGTYATVPWYANDLGLRATLGFQQYQRQDLAGGRYGLLGLAHDSESLLGKGDPVRINPDFWVNFLWKRVMGSTVYNATAAGNGDASLRVYAHCGTPPSPHAPLPIAAATNPMGLVVININSSVPRAVTLPRTETWTVWTLEAADGDVFGETSSLNGMALPRSISDGAPIAGIPASGIEHRGADSLKLPPFSVTFAAATVCTAGWQ